MVIRRSSFINVAPGNSERREEWQDGAACASAPEVDKAMFTSFPSKYMAIKINKQYCSVCPVRNLCLNWGYDERQFTGIAGGHLFTDEHRSGYKRRTVKIPEE